MKKILDRKSSYGISTSKMRRRSIIVPLAKVKLALQISKYHKALKYQKESKTCKIQLWANMQAITQIKIPFLLLIQTNLWYLT